MVDSTVKTVVGSVDDSVLISSTVIDKCASTVFVTNAWTRDYFVICCNCEMSRDDGTSPAGFDAGETVRGEHGEGCTVEFEVTSGVTCIVSGFVSSIEVLSCSLFEVAAALFWIFVVGMASAMLLFGFSYGWYATAILGLMYELTDLACHTVNCLLGV